MKIDLEVIIKEVCDKIKVPVHREPAFSCLIHPEVFLEQINGVKIVEWIKSAGLEVDKLVFTNLAKGIVEVWINYKNVPYLIILKSDAKSIASY